MGGQDANALFAEYGQSHQHPVNKAIHCVCVPLIFFCTVRLLAALPLNGVYAATTAALIWYVWLDLRIALGMFVVSAACIYGSAFVTVPQGRAPPRRTPRPLTLRAPRSHRHLRPRLGGTGHRALKPV